MSTGSVYRITCQATGLSYVGQTRDTKSKNGIPYAYGVIGRWNDHVSCPATTPLGLAILRYGAPAFTVDTLESAIPEERLDEREAHWIAALNTCVPHGYNKMRHGRCRHRGTSTLAEFYAPKVTGIKLRQIKRNGEPHLIYAYLQQREGDEVRIVFGQGKDSTYAEAVQAALTFLEPFEDVPIDADPRVLNPDVYEYETKLSRFDAAQVSQIRLAKFNTLAAVYVDKSRICFGGKHVTYEQAVQKALAFAQALHNRHPDALLINTASKSATGGCSPS